MKYGIKIPMTLTEAEHLDRENGNDLWEKATEKETKGVRVAFQLLKENEKPPVGSKAITYHWIFTIKFDLSRKARLVAGGHTNKEVPAHMVNRGPIISLSSILISRQGVR